MEPYNTRLVAVPILFNCICRSLRFVNKVRVEDVEFVSLYNLRRWIVMIIVGLIILVPLISSVDTVEILGFPGSVLVMPPVSLRLQKALLVYKAQKLQRKSLSRGPKL